MKIYANPGSQISNNLAAAVERQEASVDIEVEGHIRHVQLFGRHIASLDVEVEGLNSICSQSPRIMMELFFLFEVARCRDWKFSCSM